MKTIIERITKTTSAQILAWVDGELRSVYFVGPHLYASPAKYFVRDRDNNKVKVVKGRVYQDEQGKPYFLSNN